MQGKLDGMWEANILTLIIVIRFQDVAEVTSTLVVGVVALAGFFESFVALGEGRLDWDTAELSAVDVL